MSRSSALSDSRAEPGVGKSGRDRRFVFTLNNPTEGCEDYLKGRECRYLVFGREIGASGTPHLQGYVEFTMKKSIRAVKNWFGPYNPHIESAKGNAEQASEYCKKDGDYFEKGERSITKKEKAKKAGDAEIQRWEKAFEDAKEGKFDEIPCDIRVKYYRTWKVINKDFMKQPDDLEAPCGVWIWGASGLGKSTYARALVGGKGFYPKMANKWWDGYQGEDDVILDDLDCNHACLGHHLKIWADKYPFVCENKGGASALRPKRFIITSQYSIGQVWEDEQFRVALRRRFKVIHFNDFFKRSLGPYPYSIEALERRMVERNGDDERTVVIDGP